MIQGAPGDKTPSVVFGCESLENEARVQAELGGTADHRAATLAFVNRQDRRSRGASGT
jgi:hypothetical protein